MTIKQIVKSRQANDLRLELTDKMEALTVELDCARGEIERIRERYREALVSSTKSNMQASQLAEELEAAKQQASKGERNALREARRAEQLAEEKATLAKRCEQLGLLTSYIIHILFSGSFSLIISRSEPTPGATTALRASESLNPGEFGSDPPNNLIS